MPTYVFTCQVCGRFEESRPMASAGDAATCPAFRGRAQRVFTPPHLPVLAAGVRRALSAEEASAHEPRVVGEKRGRPMPHLATSPAPPWALSGH
jgi:putative FmdB family regulatory protein